MNIYYDLTYFLKPTGENAVESVSEKIKASIKKINGVLVEELPSIKKGLSYAVRKHNDGFLCSIKFLADPKEINFINSFLKKDASVLRFLIKKVEKRENNITYKRRQPPPFIKKEKPVQKQDENQIAEIDKKLEELLGK